MRLYFWILYVSLFLATVIAVVYKGNYEDALKKHRQYHTVYIDDKEYNEDRRVCSKMCNIYKYEYNGISYITRNSFDIADIKECKCKSVHKSNDTTNTIYFKTIEIYRRNGYDEHEND
jgi:hypothetical protein